MGMSVVLDLVCWVGSAAGDAVAVHDGVLNALGARPEPHARRQRAWQVGDAAQFLAGVLGTGLAAPALAAPRLGVMTVRVAAERVAGAARLHPRTRPGHRLIEVDAAGQPLNRLAAGLGIQRLFAGQEPGVARAGTRVRVDDPGHDAPERRAAP